MTVESRAVTLLQVPHLLSLLEAAHASAQVVRAGILGTDHSSRQKSDGTIVTAVDERSEEAAKAVLARSSLPVLFEESGLQGELAEAVLIGLYDPQDGTGGFEHGGSTSTISASLYNQKHKRVTASIVVEASTGRLWVGARNHGVWRGVLPDGPVSFRSVLAAATRCRVWQGWGNRATTWVDFSPTFTKEGYPPVPAHVWGSLYPKLWEVTRVGTYGTNCGHFALVTNGAPGAAATITTAVGGPWDVAPVFLVLEAGGFARAFSTKGGLLTEVQPLQVMDYNLVVSGCFKESVDALSDIVVSHLRENGIVS